MNALTKTWYIEYGLIWIPPLIFRQYKVTLESRINSFDWTNIISTTWEMVAIVNQKFMYSNIGQI